MKRCIDCKHCKPHEFPNLSSCERLVSTRVCPVTGEVTPVRHRWEYCSTHRGDGWFWSRMFGTCGKAGRFFEAKS